MITNPIEALAKILAERHYGRLISVSYTVASDTRGIKYEAYREYVIAIQPAFDGLAVQNFTGSSLDEALNKFETAANFAAR